MGEKGHLNERDKKNGVQGDTKKNDFLDGFRAPGAGPQLDRDSLQCFPTSFHFPE